MLLSKLVRGQLVAFVLVSVLGVSYAAVAYLHLPRLLGIGTYHVTLDLSRAGGLYENALVTMRGVAVGKVERIDLSRGGVRTVLGIDDGTRIPADSAISVRSMSAIGEQFVDFEPPTDTAPNAASLADGQLIPGSRVTFGTPVGDLLTSLNQFAATLPLDKVNPTVDELYDAFNGTGGDLDRLLRSASQLEDVASQNLDPTVKLVQQLVPVLSTQQQIGPQVVSFTGDLAKVTDTLHGADPSLRGAIDKTGPMADELDALIGQVRPTLPQLLTDLSSTGQVLRVYQPNVRHLLVVFPAAVAALTSTTAQGIQASAGANPPLMSAMGFKLTFDNPPPCTTGFDPDRVAPTDTSNSHAPPTDAYCKEPKDSPIAVRGLRNSPCPPGSPTGPGSTSATASGCGLDFQTPAEAKAATDAAVQHELAVAARNPKTRAENEAFIGDADFPRVQAPGSPPAINGAGDTSHTAPNGLFQSDGKSYLNGAALPLPTVSTADGPLGGAAQFVLGPILSPTGS